MDFKCKKQVPRSISRVSSPFQKTLNTILFDSSPMAKLNPRQDIIQSILSIKQLSSQQKYSNIASAIMSCRICCQEFVQFFLEMKRIISMNHKSGKQIRTSKSIDSTLTLLKLQKLVSMQSNLIEQLKSKNQFLQQQDSKNGVDLARLRLIQQDYIRLKKDSTNQTNFINLLLNTESKSKKIIPPANSHKDLQEEIRLLKQRNSMLCQDLLAREIRQHQCQKSLKKKERQSKSVNRLINFLKEKQSNFLGLFNRRLQSSKQQVTFMDQDWRSQLHRQPRVRNSLLDFLDRKVQYENQMIDHPFSTLRLARMILDRYYNHFRLNQDHPELMFDFNVFTWLTLDKQKSSYFQVEVHTSEAVSCFVTNLKDTMFGTHWEICYFNDLIDGHIPLDQIAVYLHLRFNLLGGLHIYGSNFGTQICRYISFETAMSLASSFFQRSQVLNSLINSLCKGIVKVSKRDRLDLGFTLKIMMEAYRYFKDIEKKKMEKQYNQLMKSNYSYRSFLLTLAQLKIKGTSLQTVRLYSSLIRQFKQPNFRQFYTTCENSGYFIHFLKLMKSNFVSDYKEEIKQLGHQFEIISDIFKSFYQKVQQIGCPLLLDTLQSCRHRLNRQFEFAAIQDLLIYLQNLVQVSSKSICLSLNNNLLNEHRFEDIEPLSVSELMRSASAMIGLMDKVFKKQRQEKRRIEEKVVKIQRMFRVYCRNSFNFKLLRQLKLH